MQEQNNSVERRFARVSKGLSFNYNQLFREFGEQSVLARDIIVLTTSHLSKDLFGGIEFTVDNILKLGYNRTYLQRLVPKFNTLSSDDIERLQDARAKEIGDNEVSIVTKREYLTNRKGELIKDENDQPIELPFLGSHLCVTNLEYTLYRLYYQQIEFIRKRGDRNESSIFKFFSSLIIDYDRSTRKKTKHKYYIYPGNKILEDYFHDYYLIDMDEYANLSSPKIETLGALRNFYIYMGRIIAKIKQNRDSKKPQEYILSVDEIIDIFNKTEADFIKTGSKGKKQAVTRTLDEINNQIQKARFNWQYVKMPGYRFAFHVQFTFEDEVLDYFDERMKKTFLNKYHANLKGYYIQKKSGIGNFKEEEFYNWLNSSEDLEDKKQYYQVTYKEIYKITMPDNIERIEIPKLPDNQHIKPLKLKEESKPKKKKYHKLEDLQKNAIEMNITVEELARRCRYQKDDKGYYSIID